MRAYGDRQTPRSSRRSSALLRCGHPLGLQARIEALQANRATIDNIRLWDEQPLMATFGQLQEDPEPTTSSATSTSTATGSTAAIGR